VADFGSSGKHHRRADVRVVGKFPVRHPDQASRARVTDVRRSRHRHGRRLSWSQDSPVDLAAVEPELLNSGTWPPGEARPRSFDISLVSTEFDDGNLADVDRL
jgi:hypothetical protein